MRFVHSRQQSNRAFHMMLYQHIPLACGAKMYVYNRAPRIDFASLQPIHLLNL